MVSMIVTMVQMKIIQNCVLNAMRLVISNVKMANVYQKGILFCFAFYYLHRINSFIHSFSFQDGNVISPTIVVI